MPWRLIEFIIILAIELIFIMLNQHSASDVSFGFFRFYNVPVYVTAFVAFMLGILAATPFFIFSRFKRKEKLKDKKNKRAAQLSAEQPPAEVADPLENAETHEIE